MPSRENISTETRWMGLLRRKAGNREGVFLRSQQTLGRDHDNEIVLPRSSISARHASLAWTTSGWVLKDTSTYGTLVNGEIVKGAARPLVKGDELTFVEADEVWILDDASPPGLLLSASMGDQPPIHVEHADALLALPSPEHPELTLFRLAESWFMDSDRGERRKIVDRSSITVGGVTYIASVPRMLSETAEPENPASPFTLDAALLEIGVLRGEDEAELTIRCGAVERAVKPSRPLYLLAYLAEQRSKEPSDDGGWLPTDLVCRELGVDRSVLNVDVHRVREAVKATGLLDGASIVERRPSQIRIGVEPARVSVVRR